MRSAKIKDEHQFQKECVRSFQIQYPNLSVLLSASLNEAGYDKTAHWEKMGRNFGKEDLTLHLPVTPYAFLALELKHEKTVFQDTQKAYKRELDRLEWIRGVKVCYEVCRWIPPFQEKKTPAWYRQRHINIEGNEELWAHWENENDRRAHLNPTWYFDLILDRYMKGEQNEYSILFQIAL